MASNERILYLLKTRGAQSSQQLAAALELTSMGARKQLLVLAEQGLVDNKTQSEGRGRPQQLWQLTAAGHSYFPDRHADVTLQLLDSVQQLFGAAGVEKLIAQRELQQQQQYQQDNSWYLTEHHCPICAAATACQGFCRAELALFQHCAGSQIKVERVQHVLSGDKRCTYRFTPLT